jgi:ABC-2 type transport system ATP-binding protein
MIILEKVKKSYDESLVLDGLSLEMKPGQFVALMGKNGSGKSTLMRLLAKSELVDQGTISFNNKDLASVKTEINPYLAFVTENHQLPDNDSIGKWISYYKLIYPSFDVQTFEFLLSSFELNTNSNFSQLSRGQKAKMLFALNASKKPSVYLLDEITSVLDSGSRIALMQFLKKEIERNCLVVMSTNIISEMQGFATDICFIDNTNILLYSAVADFNTKFIKFRAPYDLSHEQRSIIEASKSKQVKNNADNTWSYLAEINQSQVLESQFVMVDRREITIEDVANYLTV